MAPQIREKLFRLSLEKKKPEVDKEPIWKLSGTPSSDLVRLFASQSTFVIQLSGQQTVSRFDVNASWSQPDGEHACAGA